MSDDKTELPSLTDKQMAFVQGLLAGKTASDAYRAAYDAENMSDNALWCAASKLKSNTKVTQWLNAVRVERLRESGYSLDAHMAELDEAAQIAKETGNIGAMVKAIESKGRAMGLYIDRHQDVTEDDPLQMLDQIASTISTQLAEGLAREMGIEWKPSHKLN